MQREPYDRSEREVVREPARDAGAAREREREREVVREPVREREVVREPIREREVVREPARERRVVSGDDGRRAGMLAIAVVGAVLALVIAYLLLQAAGLAD